MRVRTTLVLAAAVFGSLGSQLGPSEQPVDRLLWAERSFSEMSVKDGMKPAFLHWFADDGLMFWPGPTNAKQLWAGWPDSKNTLIWQPSYGEVSGAEDLGVTFGPSEIRPPKGSDAPVRHGHFVSVWRREAKGPWQVVADLGISHGKPEHGVGNTKIVRGPTHEPPKPYQRRGGLSVGGGVFSGNFGVGVGVGPGTLAAENDVRHRQMAQETNRMMSAERGYAFEIRRKDVRAALLKHAAEDLRFFRDGSLPSLGIDAAAAAQTARGRHTTFLPRGNRVSESYDLGYTYGLVESRRDAKAKPDTSGFLHVWRRDEKGAWKLIVDAEKGFE